MTRLPWWRGAAVRFLALLLVSLSRAAGQEGAQAAPGTDAAVAVANQEDPRGPRAGSSDPEARGASEDHGEPPSILLSIRSAHVLLPRSGPSGAVQLWADFAATLPRPGDVISVSFAGVRLFSEPFSSFSGAWRPQTYVLERKGLLAWFDFGRWELSVLASWVALPPLDPVDGYVVQVQIGDGLAWERIDLLPRGERLLLFQRRGSEPAP